MSELITNGSGERSVRWRLLATVSMAALAVGFFEQAADAADTFLSSNNQPSFWVELGGDFERIDGQTDRWTPPVRGILSGSGMDVRKDASGSFGMEGRASYQPEDSPWMVWAAALYGRAQRQQSFHTQTKNYAGVFGVLGTLFAANYTTKSRHTENHMIVDFAVGRDVGLGILGKSGHAIISAGFRIAQFGLDSEEFASSHPHYSGVFVQKRYHQTVSIERRTSAMGPAISLDASLPIVSGDDNALLFDWGVGGAVLFGRQKVVGHLVSHYEFNSPTNIYRTTASDSARAKSVVIPNVNAFVGLSYRLPAAKVSVGYRADLYLGGVDGGVGAPNRTNHSLYGPFARISFGIGG